MPTDLASASYALLALAVVAGTVGVPIPLSVVLATAGAMARQGHLNVEILAAVSLAAAVGGDTAGYGAGALLRRFMPAPLRAYAPRNAAYERLRAWIERHTDLGLTIFLTRWALTAAGTPVNLLAGYRGYSLRRFLIFDTLGEAAWVAISLAPGFLFGAADGLGLVLSAGLGVVLAIGMPLSSHAVLTAMDRRRRPRSMFATGIAEPSPANSLEVGMN